MLNSANQDARRAARSDRELESEERWLESLATACGWIVAAGVVVEYAPAFMVFIHAPSWETFKSLVGGALIALGVAGEVLFSRIAAKKQSELNARKDLLIAELNLLAEQEQTARAQIEAKLARRSISNAAFSELADVLKPFAGTVVQVVVFDDHFEEVRKISLRIKELFQFSGWRVPVWSALAWNGLPRVRGAGILFCIVLSEDNIPLCNMCEKVIAILNRENPGVAELKRFGVSQHAQSGFASPDASVLEDIAPVRIQIGERQIG